jgi:hypothetical protein
MVAYTALFVNHISTILAGTGWNENGNESTIDFYLSDMLTTYHLEIHLIGAPQLFFKYSITCMEHVPVASIFEGVGLHPLTPKKRTFLHPCQLWHLWLCILDFELASSCLGWHLVALDVMASKICCFIDHTFYHGWGNAVHTWIQRWFLWIWT